MLGDGRLGERDMAREIYAVRVASLGHHPYDLDTRGMTQRLQHRCESIRVDCYKLHIIVRIRWLAPGVKANLKRAMSPNRPNNVRPFGSRGSGSMQLRSDP